DGAIAPLIARLQDSNREVRMRVVASLGDLMVGKRVPPALFAALKDADELVRIEACESLGAIGDKRGLPLLWESIHDRSSLVMSYAAGAIGELGAERDIHRLEA